MKHLLTRFALIALLLALCVGVTAPAVFGSDDAETVTAVEDTDVTPDQDEPDGLNRLIAETGADVQMAPQTGTARFIRWSGNNAQRISARLGRSGSASSRADAFLREYGSVFGVRDVATELVLASTFTDTLATEHLVYNQVYRGIPVFAGTIRFHFDGRGVLTAVNGIFIPKLALNPNVSVSEERARQIAVGHVSRSLALDVENPRKLSVDLGSKSARLVVYRAGLAQGLIGTNHLVYEVEVASGAAVREFVYVDAHTGVVVDQISGVHEDLSRRVYDGGYGSSFQVWQEEDGPYLGDDKDIQNIIDFSKDTYDLFANMTRGTYRSYDGRDARMKTVNDDPGINCPNANWNGTSTNYCTGVTGDDTVAHEWGHAYTEKTQNLIYAWQPGALNESYSDIIGEIVDLINGAGLDDPGGPRTATACSVYQPSFPVVVQVNTPTAIAGTYDAASAAFGPPLDITGITGDLVIGEDGDTTGTGGTTTDGCQALTNASDIAGKIAVIDRGACSFVVKAKNAQDAGAIAALIVNHADGGDSIFPMSGSDESITIPSVFIGKTAGDIIKAELPGVNVTLKLNPGPVTPDVSYRWLSGENDPAFNGAIRDLWTPTCFGDPGKVTDTQYSCSAADGGGVHSNSGVPNHGFALIVDGGDYNGQSIQPLGLTKAAHIYWRTMTTYQHQASGFMDHADSLQAACSDLVGQNLLSLTDGQPSGEIISQTDCEQVAKVISAIELRTAPTQCAFEPLLVSGAPELCAVPGGTATTVFFDNFESKPVTWAMTNAGVFPEYRSSDWAWISNLPGDRSGSAVFGINSAEVGDCNPGSDDQSGAKYIESPEIIIPAESQFARVAFEHYVATEDGYDGGNLWVQVNGGNWKFVAPSDYDFNPYNTSLSALEDGNTNPLAGLPSFSGSDSGSVAGSWGQSQVNLSAYTERGDTIKLRFALGVDGCNGLDGWYVDDVRVYFCPAEVSSTARLVFADGATSLTANLAGGGSSVQTFALKNAGLAELTWSAGEDGVVAAGRAMPSGWSGQSLRAPKPEFAGLARHPRMVQFNNVVQDGSFEAGTPNPSWAESATTFGPPICSLALCGVDFAQDGSWYAWFGGWGALHQSALTQTVTIANSGAAELSFWVVAVGVAGEDNVTVSLDGSPLFVVNTANAADFADGYVQVKLDVSSYADGGDHLLALNGSTVGGILLDNVVLNDWVPPCTNQKDIPWLSISPTSGTVAKGQSVDVSVTIDATGLGTGTYEAFVCMTTNDQNNPQITVPVHMSIPAASWAQTVFVNGVEYMDTQLISGITSSDVISVVDRVVVTSTGGITFSLRYGWTESLVLTDTKTSQSGSSGPVGVVSSLSQGISEWVVQDGTSGASHTIVRTFTVAPGTKSVGRLSERLVVEGISKQLPDVGFTFQPMMYWYFPIIGK